MQQPPKLNLRKLEGLQRVLRYAAVVVLAVFVGLIAYSGYKLRQINREIDDKQARLAGLDEALKKRESELAESNRTIETQDTTIETLIDPKRPLSAEQAEEVEKTVEQKVGEITNTRQIPPRVYIQFAHEEQRKSVGEVARQLQAIGFLTPGISRASGAAPRLTQLRYYKTNEVSEVAKADIRNLLRVLRGIGISAGNLVSLKESSGVRPRHYEIYFGDDFARNAPPVETESAPTPEPTREPTPGPTRKPTPKFTPRFSPRPPRERPS
jgi:hypothetical protein